MNIPTIAEDILDELNSRILILDGAMGTMIQQYQLEENDFRNDSLHNHPKLLKGNNDLLNITRPDIIEAIHLAYYEAGADIIETNTFSGTSIAQADYGLEKFVHDINFFGVKCALNARDTFYKTHGNSEKKWIAGAMGPTNKTASLSPDVNRPEYRAIDFDQLHAAYYEQAEILMETGADILLVETVFDTLNAKAALFAIQTLFENKKRRLPIMVSGTIVDASGRTLSGQTVEAFVASLSHVPLLSFGLNCSLGAHQLHQHAYTMAHQTNIPTCFYPNAGLPNAFGQYDQTPDEMAKEMTSYLENSLANIIGGCCGTTPEHIKKLKLLSKNYSPRKFEKIVF